MKDFENWRRLIASQLVHPPGQSNRQLYVPAIEPVGDLPYEIAGLLPNREHSKDLMVLIDSLPANKFGPRSVVGVFAADPFLNCKRVADRLLAKGYQRVTNIPPVSGYGREFLATLDKVAAGQAQEQRNIGRLVERGLSVSPALASIEGLSAALYWSPTLLWVVPSFDMWRGNSIAADLLLKLCGDVTHRTKIPVVLIAGQLGLTPTEAARAGARGILVDER